jgi:hypothetical protein
MTMTLSARREPGRVGVEIDADDLVRPPYLDILVEWAVAAPPEEETFADELVIKDFEPYGYSTTLKTALDSLIAAEALRVRVGARLVKALQTRTAVQCREDSRHIDHFSMRLGRHGA